MSFAKNNADFAPLEVHGRLDSEVVKHAKLLCFIIHACNFSGNMHITEVINKPEENIIKCINNKK